MGRLPRSVRLVTGITVSVMLVWWVGASGAGSTPKAEPTKATPKAAAKPVQTARPALPDWAPKHPSPEFLRAAKVLKPIPDSANASVYARHPERRASDAARKRTWPAAWEVFGATMTDVHIRVLRSTVKTKTPDYLSDRAAWERWFAGQPKVPIRTLTRGQRALVDNYVKVCRQNNTYDWLVGLYKKGAKEDLSNVAIGFLAEQHYVTLQWWVDRGDGKGWIPAGGIEIGMM